jgi:hypothetical protein
MTPTVEQLKAMLSGLAVADRAELAYFLLRTLEPEDPGASAEWLSLAQQRMDEVRAGKVKGVPAEQLLEELRGCKP